MTTYPSKTFFITYKVKVGGERETRVKQTTSPEDANLFFERLYKAYEQKSWVPGTQELIDAPPSMWVVEP